MKIKFQIKNHLTFEFLMFRTPHRGGLFLSMVIYLITMYTTVLNKKALLHIQILFTDCRQIFRGNFFLINIFLGCFLIAENSKFKTVCFFKCEIPVKKPIQRTLYLAT